MANNSVFINTAGGGSNAGLTVGTSAITGGSDGTLLFDNNAVLGELILGTNLSISGGNTLNSSGGAAGLVVGTSVVSGGSAGRVLYDNGTLGEMTTTGSGTVLALATSPVLVTPTLGVASATTVNKITLTTPATGSTLTIIDGKTLTANKTMSLTAADDTGIYTFPTGTKTLLATTGSPAALVIASQATGDILYASSASAWARLGVGSAGQVLTLAGGVPTWAAASGTSTLTIGTTAIASGTVGRVLYHAAADVLGEMTTTGSGTVLALATSPTFVTPVLGAATGTSLTLSSFAKFSGFYQNYITKTADFPLDETCGTVELLTNAATFTLPAAASFPNRVFCLKNLQILNVLTVARSGSDTIDNASSALVAAGCIWVHSDGVSSWRVLATVGLDISTVSQGDLIYGSGTNVLSLLPKDTNNSRYLQNQGTNNNPIWASINLANGVGTSDLPFANLTQGSARSVLGVTGNATADFASIQGTADQVLRINGAGTALAFGAIDLSKSAAVTGLLPFANLTQGSAHSVLGVTGNATADNASIQSSAAYQVLRANSANTAVAFGAIDISQSGAVTGLLPYANMVNATAISVLVGRGAAAGAGVLQEITLGAGLTMTGTVLSAPTGGSGTVTVSGGGNLTSNAVVLGAGTQVTKTVAGMTTDGTSQLTLGVAGASTGATLMTGATSGTVTLTVAAAAGTHTIKLPTADGSANQVLKTDGSGQWGWVSGGTGTVTHTGNLTANAVVLGNAFADTLVVAGITTDGTSILNLGVNATTIGKVKMFGNTSGDVTLTPQAVAGTATVLTLPASTDTLVGKATTDTLTNKILSDSTCFWGDNGDTTKRATWELSGATTSTTLTLISAHTAARSITFPDATGTLPIILKNTGTASTDFTGSTAETNLGIITVPAGVMGANGHLQITALWKFTNANGTKNTQYRWSTSSGDTSGGTVMANVTTLAANLSAYVQRDFWNANATNSQIAMGGTGAGANTASATPLTSAIDTTAVSYINLNVTLANASDKAQLVGYSCVLYPGV